MQLLLEVSARIFEILKLGLNLRRGKSEVVASDNDALVLTGSISIQVLHTLEPPLFYGDASYASTTVTQSDSVQIVTTVDSIGNPLANSATNGGTAETGRTVPIASYGYGGYSTHAQTSAVDTCDGKVFPPFDSGIINGQTSAEVITTAPKVYLGADAPGSIAVSPNYGSAWPSTASATAITDIPSSEALPQWSLSGPAAQQFQLSCTSCESTTITPIKPTPVACNTVLTIKFTIGDLTATPAALIVMSANANTPGTSPTTGNFVDNQQVNSSNQIGYTSLQYWNIEDQCGDNLSSLEAFEAFPSGFSSVVTNNWPTPVAKPWVTGTGGWFDTINEQASVNPPGLNPMPTVPQSPLTSQAIYRGSQQIWAGLSSSNNSLVDTLVTTLTQTHYLDHGLSQ